MSLTRKLMPTAEELDALRRDAPPGPVVAVNLLKFKAGVGRAAFKQYAEVSMSAMPEGTRVLYTGVGGHDFGGGEDWDFVVLVEYKNAQVFADFISGQAYQEHSAPLRPQALERTLWMISHPASTDAIWE